MAKITASSGNVFEDLGFTPEEAVHLKLRAELLIALEAAISGRKLTQAAIARTLGIHQSRVSDIKRQKISAFSLDKLVDLLSRAGQSVEVRVSPHRKKAERRAAA